jgi:hypothetical protein
MLMLLVQGPCFGNLYPRESLCLWAMLKGQTDRGHHTGSRNPCNSSQTLGSGRCSGRGGACRRFRRSGSGRSWVPSTGLRGRGEMCSRQPLEGALNTRGPCLRSLRPSSPCRSFSLKVSREGQQTNLIPAHPAVRKSLLMPNLLSGLVFL